ncbi:MAG: peptidylprolyl isomerase [Porticoccaceae bacterium]|nr:peptidylprolyl isomerase [Porticoccaceae bacterium]
MQIKKDCVVQFAYVLKDIAGKVVESSEGAGPTTYMHGHGGMLPALEQELAGLSVGAQVSAKLSQPYGPSHPDSVQRVPLKHLRAKKKPEPGSVVVVQGKDGQRQVTVVKVGRYSVDIETNHPFAGMDLIFDIDVLDVREASAEELRHGHAHGPGGHQH